MDNTAFLLFLDVVGWFCLDWYTTFMSYSDEFKLFSRTDLRPFGRRVLSYMGGPKNKGQFTSKEALTGKYDCKSLKINFIVSDRRTLNDDVKYVTGNNHASRKRLLRKCQNQIKHRLEHSKFSSMERKVIHWRSQP